MRASIDNTVVVQGRVWPLSRFMDQSRRVWAGGRKSIARGGRPGDVSLQPDDRPMRRRRRRPISTEQSISKDTHARAISPIVPRVHAHTRMCPHVQQENPNAHFLRRRCRLTIQKSSPFRARRHRRAVTPLPLLRERINFNM